MDMKLNNTFYYQNIKYYDKFFKLKLDLISNKIKITSKIINYNNKQMNLLINKRKFYIKT